MNSNVKTAVFWVVIIMVVVLLWTVVRQTKSRPDAQPSFSQLMNDVRDKKVKSVTITGNDLHGVYAGSNEEFHAVVPSKRNTPFFLQRKVGLGPVAVTVKMA